MRFVENYSLVIRNAAQAFHWNNLCQDTVAVFEFQRVIIKRIKTNKNLIRRSIILLIAGLIILKTSMALPCHSTGERSLWWHWGYNKNTCGSNKSTEDVDKWASKSKNLFQKPKVFFEGRFTYAKTIPRKLEISFEIQTLSLELAYFNMKLRLVEIGKIVFEIKTFSLKLGKLHMKL